MNHSTADIGRAQLAPVMEVFSSVQGEGLYAGELQVFLRLAGCPLRCRYCDTPGSWDPLRSGGARVQTPDGARREESFCSPFRATCLISEVEPSKPRTVSVTGGEPLLWPEFLLGLGKVVGPRRLHLETAGGHPETLARVVEIFDHVSLDLKLPRDLDPPEAISLASEFADEEGAPRFSTEASPVTSEDWKRARRASLRLLANRDACGKIVVCGGTPAEDYELLLDEVAEYAKEMPVFLQPATRVRDTAAPLFDDVLDLAEAARDRELDVRVLPQIHRSLNIP